MGSCGSKPKTYEVNLQAYLDNRQSLQTEYKTAQKSLAVPVLTPQTVTIGKAIKGWPEIFAKTLNVSTCLVVTSDTYTRVLATYREDTHRDIPDHAWFLGGPESDPIIAVEDASIHSKFWQAPSVTKSPGIRFYACAPVMLGDGDVFAYVCYAHPTPKKLDPRESVFIACSADILAYQISNEAPPQSNASTACILCDVDEYNWKILYANKTWQAATKVYAGAAVLDNFAIGSPSQHVNVNASAFDARLFNTGGMHLHVHAERAWQGTVPMLCDKMHITPWLFRLYIMTSDQSNLPSIVSPFEDVAVISLLGSGSFGSVFEARWGSRQVAVKVLCTKGVVPQEASLGKQLSHPHVLATYDCRIDGENTWILLEICLGGALRKVIDEGYYRLDRDACIAIDRACSTALQISKGMQYLHEHDILHGDLSSNNVLMTTTMTAKVADFGLSRLASVSTVATETYGTVTHMPPELLSKGLLSKSSDVYSFGVILYELLSSQRAYAGLRQSQIFAAKMLPCNEHFALPEAIPSALQHLMWDCLNVEYHARPQFEQVVKRLQDYTS